MLPLAGTGQQDRPRRERRAVHVERGLAPAALDVSHGRDAAAASSRWSGCRTRSSDTMAMTGFLDFFTVHDIDGARRCRCMQCCNAMHWSASTLLPDARPIAGYKLRAGRALPVRRDARARRRQLLGLLAPRDRAARWCSSRRARPSRWPRSPSRRSSASATCSR